MITTLIFDLGGVLIHIHQNRFEEKILRMFPAVDRDRLNDAFFRSPNKDLLESGHISSEQFLERSGRRLGLHIDPALFADFWTDIFSENQEISGLLPMFRGTYTLALLSNTNKPHMDYIRTTFPFLSLFDHLFLSYEMQRLKPERALYQEVLHTLGISPAEALFIDDNEANTAAAAALGISCIHFQNNDDCLKTLSRMGIL